MLVYEIALLIGCHLHHALLAVRVQCGEDPPVHTEVGVRHVLAFDGILQPQRDLPEVGWFHRLSVEEAVGGWTSRWSAAQACRHHPRQHSDTESLVDILRSSRSEDVRRLIAAGSATAQQRASGLPRGPPGNPGRFYANAPAESSQRQTFLLKSGSLSSADRSLVRLERGKHLLELLLVRGDRFRRAGQLDEDVPAGRRHDRTEQAISLHRRRCGGHWTAHSRVLAG